MWKEIIFVLSVFGANCIAENYYVKLRQTNNGKDCLILSEETIKRFKGFKDTSENALSISTKSAVSYPADAKIMTRTESDDLLIEIYARRQEILDAHVQTLCKIISHVEPLRLRSPASGKPVVQEPEVVKIIDSGDQNNRIDVVFMGDGYTAEERQEFFDDMRRLIRDMFETTTFRSYLPVFNIWAIFVESNYSGIGYTGPLNTPFQLFRESGQLRAIYPGNPEYARQICQLTGPSGCDYPSLIANDDYYGGLGGEFVISTRSNRTGTIVLRHEMGHNFVDVGEEYDNGWVYSGVNAAPSVESLGWSHWLTGEKREERAIYRLNAYPWKDLSQGEFEAKFISDGKYFRWYMIVSVSAAGDCDSLEFLLDGNILPWTTTGYDDREFYSWRGQEGFSAGNHTLIVRSKTDPTNANIPRMICSVNIHEYGNEDEFHADNEHISAYPTWNILGVKSFRPGNEKCLMRNMSSTSFCSVCQEGMWHQFFQKIWLIDNVTVEAVEGNPETRKLTVHTLRLGQLRHPSLTVPGEKLNVLWYLNEEEQVTFEDQFSVSVPTGSGNWTAIVTFVTPEVRSDPKGLLTDSHTVTV